MARFITRPGPPPPKHDENDDNFAEYGDPEIDPEPEEFPEVVPFEDEIEQVTPEAQEDDEEIEDVCMDWWIYAKPIEVYQCLKSPEKLAWDLFLWERLDNIGIDQCVDVHPASPCQPETIIPPEALYVIVGDTISQNPYGHTLLFCRRVIDRPTGYDKYIPLRAFFYSFTASTSTTIQSLSEYFQTRAVPSQLVTLYERIPYQDEARFPEVFNMMTDTVNREMNLLKMGRRVLRNIMGTNRAKPTRWRCIVGLEPPVVVVPEKKKKKAVRKVVSKKKKKTRGRK
ncbi:hypothetical protein FKW77_003164 [Venturia effusa]|uniref:Uncharacterized protein n=1 Tax=Venturia effusa TaxID=50376 RepID=A0A517LMK3_9PEZI|nr:hypothetical protein FKW77_003164 [Venturia effusa]